MKIGSLVVCVDSSNLKRPDHVKPLVKGKIYTIRSINKYPDGYGATLDEVVNEKVIFTTGLLEPVYNIIRFRELDTPTEINLENILKNELV